MAQKVLKDALREAIKKTLKELTEESKEKQSQIILQKIISADFFKRSQRISIYLSMENEANTTNILREMFSQGKTVFVPTYKGDLMEMVRLDGMEDYNSLPLTKWNIKQPNIDDHRENVLDFGGLDLFLVPGVGFTRKGYRLGHGKGYYDRYFKKYFERYPERYDPTNNVRDKLKKKKTILVGVAFKEQILNDIPLDEHDFILDHIITSE